MTVVTSCWTDLTRPTAARARRTILLKPPHRFRAQLRLKFGEHRGESMSARTNTWTKQPSRVCLMFATISLLTACPLPQRQFRNNQLQLLAQMQVLWSYEHMLIVSVMKTLNRILRMQRVLHTNQRYAPQASRCCLS